MEIKSSGFVRRIAFALILSGCSTAFPQLAAAALVTLSGTHVDFIIDDAQPGLGYYGGLPTVVGDALIFTPTTFRAESVGTGAVPETENLNANIVFNIVSRSGEVRLGNVLVHEAGDYFISQDSGGSVQAVAQVGATNLNAANPVLSYVQAVSDTGPLTDDGVDVWDLTTSIDFMTAWSSATSEVRVNLQNFLSATTVAQAATSWIEKKFNGMSVEVSVVPLPAAFGLLLSGLAALFAVPWRRRYGSHSAPLLESA